MNEWMQQHPASIGGLVLWAIGLLWLMPSGKPGKSRPGLPGIILAAAGVLAFCLGAGRGIDTLQSEVMFWTFALTALLCAALMITSKNPVYGALWFALATLGTCGLFMLQSAPFLAAATIIVYAGAVIVTFLFVIMLAQQSGAAGYDRRAQLVVPAVLSSFVLLGVVVQQLQTNPLKVERPGIVAAEKQSTTKGSATSPPPLPSPDAPIPPPPPVIPSMLSKATPETPVGSMKGLGRSLFGDYLFAVELAGTILLVASIGAIAIAPRREEGAL